MVHHRCKQYRRCMHYWPHWYRQSLPHWYQGHRQKWGSLLAGINDTGEEWPYRYQWHQYCMHCQWCTIKTYDSSPESLNEQSAKNKLNRTELIWYRTYFTCILNLFDTEFIWSGPFIKRIIWYHNFFYTELIWCGTDQIPNLLDTKFIRYWT